MPRQPSKTKWNAKDLSPVGWYVATYLERFEFAGEDKSNLSRRCRAWMNTILVRARNPDDAYRRAREVAKAGSWISWTNVEGARGKLRFEGLVSLLPVYDRIEDGCEIAWTDYTSRSVRTIKAMVTPKADLAVFRDYRRRPRKRAGGPRKK